MQKPVVWALSALVAAALRADDLTPRVGAVDIFGVRKSSLHKVQAALGIQEGSPLPASKGALEDQLDKLPGIVASRVDAYCCVDGRSIVYVGIQEKGAPHLEFRPAPDGDITLPVELTNLYDDFIGAVDQSNRMGARGESFNLGYSMMDNPGVRSYQRQFIPLVAKYLETVHRVVRTSRDDEQRSIAAYLLQYGPRGERTTRELIDDLQYALQDVDDSVRANATRALTAMYIGGKLHPEQKIDIRPTWFVELLNSIAWSDRHNAALALVEMTEEPNPEVIQLIRERGLLSIVEMARWHDLSKALPAFILAGRVAGMSKKDIDDAWVSDDGRESVLKAAAKSRHS